jgi:hypothetical protein
MKTHASILSVLIVLAVVSPALAQVKSSRASLDALIDCEGKTPPKWFKDTPLNYPKSLDLSWPMKPPQGWDNQKNVGQFVWDVVNPNPSRFR